MDQGDRPSLIDRRQPLGITVGERDRRKARELAQGGGRRTIIFLLLTSVGLSLVLWIWRELASWLEGFFGPTTWTITR